VDLSYRTRKDQERLMLAYQTPPHHLGVLSCRPGDHRWQKMRGVYGGRCEGCLNCGQMRIARQENLIYEAWS
jgi:hypothetical protein